MHSVADGSCRVSERVELGVCESEVFQPFWVPDLKFYNCHLKTSKKEMARASSKSATGYPKQSMNLIHKALSNKYFSRYAV
jgi:hypothetical protein